MFSLQTMFGQGKQFYTLLEEAAQAALDAATALHQMLREADRQPALDAFKLARLREREASDKISQALVDSFITPIEREDIEALGSALYKIPKQIEKFADRYSLATRHLEHIDFAPRAAMLEQAGVTAILDKPLVDEDEVKAAGRAEGVSADIVAEALAELKAQRITRRHPGALVVGADQMLECEGRWFDKPADRAAARAQLLDLRGKTHRLVSCAVVVRNGERMWHQIDSARLTMRNFSEAFLDDYLDRVSDDVLHSVGAYQLEGLGAQLFHRVEGDFFTILGLPLLPLLGFLRVHGVGRE